MNHDNNTQDLTPNIDNFTPEEVLELFTNELKSPVNSIEGCASILEAALSTETESASTKLLLDRVIKILRGHVHKIEELRQDNYRYLEKRKNK